MRRYGRKISFSDKCKYDGLQGPYALANNLLRRYLNFCKGILFLLVDSFFVVDLQALTLDFLLLPTSRTYWHDHVQAPNPWTPSFLDSPPNTSTPACVFFKLQWQQLEWSSRCRKIFFLKTLSLCEGKLLKDLTRDSHKPQYEQHKNVARVSLIYLG